MNNYKITVMALRNCFGDQTQVMVKEVTEQQGDLTTIHLGRVSDFYPLARDCNIELWITKEETKTEEIE